MRCLSAPSGVSESDRTVGDRGVAFVDDQLDIERRLHRRLIEAGKCAPRVGRLELRHRVLSRRGLAQIETAKLAADPAVEREADRRRSARQRLRQRQRDHFVWRIARHGGAQISSGGAHLDIAEIEIDRVHGDRGHRLLDVDVDRLIPTICLRCEIRRDGDRVVIRDHALRKPRRGRAKRHKDNRNRKDGSFHGLSRMRGRGR